MNHGKRSKGEEMIFDTHTHYDDSRFDIDREALLLGMNEANVGAIVNMGATMQGAKDSVAMAKQYPFVYAAVGVHPDCAKDLNEEEFGKYLYNDLPMVDLMIRTGGEMRISNFLLWQLSYAELYFTKVYFPDFNNDEFDKAVIEYSRRDRRFGGINYDKKSN